ncbi:MAG: C_GCAxxG_C_C family protein [Anaerolineae bacterium]|nr:C_GCAxxG_C_C family protein [Anaerolineae bacterium]
MTDRIEQAWARSQGFFAEGYYCAESVLLAIAEYRGITSAVLPQIATGFCSGMADTCGTCGAVSGAIMGLGLINGVGAPGGSRAANYTAVRAFLRAFADQFGATNCLTLTGCDLGTPEGQADFRARNVGAQCAEFVGTATRLALELAEA